MADLKKKGKLEKHYTTERARNQHRWTTMSPQQRTRNREKSKERMRRKRARDSETLAEQSCLRSASKEIEAQRESQRAEWRARKGKQRALKKSKKQRPLKKCTEDIEDSADNSECSATSSKKTAECDPGKSETIPVSKEGAEEHLAKKMENLATSSKKTAECDPGMSETIPASKGGAEDQPGKKINKSLATSSKKTAKCDPGMSETIPASKGGAEDQPGKKINKSLATSSKKTAKCDPGMSETRPASKAGAEDRPGKTIDNVHVATSSKKTAECEPGEGQTTSASKGIAKDHREKIIENVTQNIESTPARKQLFSTPHTKSPHYPYPTATAKRSSAYRYKTKGVLPTDPEKFVKTLEHVVKQATPRKQAMFKESGLLNTPNTKKKNETNQTIVNAMKETDEKLKSKRGDHARMQRLFIVNTAKKAREVDQMVNIRRNLGMTWSKLLRGSMTEDEEVTRKTRSDATSNEDWKLSEEFFHDVEVSTPVPISKTAHDGHARHFLNDTMKNLHTRFMKITGKSIGLTTFKKLRPKHVLTLSKAKFRECMCEICTNVEELHGKIERFAKQHNVEMKKFVQCRELSKALQCEVPTEDCLTRNCELCKNKFDEIYGVLQKFSEESITWHRWENVLCTDSLKPTGKQHTMKKGKGSKSFKAQAQKLAGKLRVNVLDEDDSDWESDCDEAPPKSCERKLQKVSSKQRGKNVDVADTTSDLDCNPDPPAGKHYMRKGKGSKAQAQKSVKKRAGKLSMNVDVDDADSDWEPSKQRGKNVDDVEPDSDKQSTKLGKQTLQKGKSKKRVKNVDEGDTNSKSDCKPDCDKAPPKLGKRKFQKAFAERTTSVQDLIEQLREDCKGLPMHLSNATWEYRQFKLLKQNIPKGEVLMVLDFAENFRTKYRCEIQSARWAYRQVTVHPLVCYFRCDSCDKVVTENDVVISADLNHDSHAVKKFTEVVVDHHKSESRDFSQIHQYTDGCAKQYKSQNPFLKVSQGVRGVPIIRNFFGSGHGKGPADGTSAVVKQGAYRAIKAGNFFCC
jgi:hypothetical protein